MKKNITSDYDSHTKEELLEECSLRGIDGVNTSTLKADIIAALELSDEDAPKTTAPLPPPEESPLPVVARKDSVINSEPGQPLDHEYTDGIFVKRTGAAAGEPFALCIHAANDFGITHTAKNTAHTWSGTEAEFRQEFDKA